MITSNFFAICLRSVTLRFNSTKYSTLKASLNNTHTHTRTKHLTRHLSFSFQQIFHLKYRKEAPLLVGSF